VSNADDNPAASVPPDLSVPLEDAGWLFGWEAFDIPLLISLPILLLLSGFFSGSETALFSMTETERMHVRRRGSLAGRAVQNLLADPRMLLITILLGNMAVNVMYFVVSSVLMMRADVGVIGSIAMAMTTLLAIVLLGEVMPKMLANVRRTSFALLVSPPLLTLHGAILPLRIVLDRAVVTPLSRLTAPSAAPPRLDEEELAALLELSIKQGVIDADEQRLLRDVFNLSRMRVRDVMTPRVKMKSVPLHARREDVIELVRETRLHRLPVFRHNMDDVVGILPVKQYLLASGKRKVRIKKLLQKPRFVPHVATLEQLLDQFRKTKTQSAIVVDEYGGTAGIVSLEDVVERLVGDIVSGSPDETKPPEQLDRGRWRVDGNMSVHDWAEAFGQPLATTRVSTVGGLIMEHLGRAPNVGDEITVGNINLSVEAVDGSRVDSAILTLLGS
jgi:putative hemolysin